ncbi:MAG: hypothetical protein WCA32_06030 [Chromatiaceae bacterium]
MKRFFADEKMNFALLCALGAAQYQASDIGECLTVAERVGDGDFGGWIAAWSALATRLATEAAQSAAHGHRESARKAFLRASLYYDLVSSSGDFTGDFGATPAIGDYTEKRGRRPRPVSTRRLSERFPTKERSSRVGFFPGRSSELKVSRAIPRPARNVAEKDLAGQWLTVHVMPVLFI